MPDSDKTYSVWRAFGEAIIVQGLEPVWEEPGKEAQYLMRLEAPDYETACQLYTDSLNSTTDKEI